MNLHFKKLTLVGVLLVAFAAGGAMTRIFNQEKVSSTNTSQTEQPTAHPTIILKPDEYNQGNVKSAVNEDLRTLRSISEKTYIQPTTTPIFVPTPTSTPQLSTPTQPVSNFSTPPSAQDYQRRLEDLEIYKRRVEAYTRVDHKGTACLNPGNSCKYECDDPDRMIEVWLKNIEVHYEPRLKRALENYQKMCEGNNTPFGNGTKENCQRATEVMDCRDSCSQARGAKIGYERALDILTEKIQQILNSCHIDEQTYIDWVSKNNQ